MQFPHKKLLLSCLLLLTSISVGCKELDKVSKQLGFTPSNALPSELKEEMLGNYTYSVSEGHASIAASQDNPNAIVISVRTVTTNATGQAQYLCETGTECTYQSSGFFLCNKITVEGLEELADDPMFNVPPMEIHPTSNGFILKGSDPIGCGQGAYIEGEYIHNRK